MNIKYYSRKLVRHPPHITTYKILRKLFIGLKVEVESLKGNLFSTYISDREFLESLIDPDQSIDEVANHLRKGKQPSFFFQLSDKPRMLNVIKSHYQGTVEQTLADADKICEHIFDLLGSGDVYLGEKIAWHVDFKTDWVWKSKYYRKINSEVLNNSCDIKVPWELSRCQHFVTLGKAYWYNGDEKYAKEFVTQVTNWIESQPPKFGVNWFCTMDVAIRAVNWIWGYQFFRNSPILTDEFMMEFLKSLLIHAKHIMNNLEKRKPTSNHYLSNLVGLIYIGVMFPIFREAKQWREFGISELIREMDTEVYPDGVDYEASTCYHRLVTELFMSSTVLCLRNCSMFHDSLVEATPSSEFFPFPDWYMQRLRKMIDFIMHYSKPDKAAPQIGDNDDGRLHILANYGNWDRLDHTYLLSMGAILFVDARFKRASGGLHEEAFWLFGIDGAEKFSAIHGSDIALSSKGFVDGGIYVMRHEDMYAIVDCIPRNPEAVIGHLHNSRLSFDLYALGATAIIDPGTHVYTADVTSRNSFRSTAYHNTILVDSMEQNIIDPSYPFMVKEKATIKVNRWEAKKQYDLLDAEHDGYSDISVIHRRLFVFNKEDRFYILKDFLFGSGEHEVEVFFHVPPSVRTRLHQEIQAVALLSLPEGDLALIPIPLDALEVSIKQSWVSYSYGAKVPSSVIRYTAVKRFPVFFSFLICPLASNDDVVRKIENASKWAHRLVGDS